MAVEHLPLVAVEVRAACMERLEPEDAFESTC